MTISSRTPEGWPERCPVCGKAILIEPSRPAGDATCPYCGALVWVSKPAPGAQELTRSDQSGFRREHFTLPPPTWLHLVGGVVAIVIVFTASLWALGLGYAEAWFKSISRQASTAMSVVIPP